MTADLSLGSTLGDYRLERVAGRGGMGVVYEATELAMSRRVALKVIASDLADDESFRARFARELSYVVALEHPNVIPVYRAGEVDGVLFIAMRFVTGIDLRVLLSRCRRLSPRSATRIVGQVAAALDRAHAAGLVHRDVKPGNILLDGEDPDAHVYLTDFGLVKHVTSAGGLTRSGALVGTPGYIAPEQVLGEPVDARTDVYSLACVLFEMLTGRPPYQRDSEAAMLFAHVQEEPPSIREVSPDVNDGFEEVIARGMATAREDRYQSAGALARAASLAAEDRAIVVAEDSVATGAAAPKAIDTRSSASRWRSRVQENRLKSSPGAAGRAVHDGSEVMRRGGASAERGEVDARIQRGPASPQPEHSDAAPLPPAPPEAAAVAPDADAQGKSRGRRRAAGTDRGRLLPLAIAGLLGTLALIAGLLVLPAGDEDDGAPRATEELQTPTRATVPVGARPSDLITTAGSTWVANAGDGTVTRLDESTGRAQGSPIRVGGAPTALAAADGIVHVLDGSTGRLTRIEAKSGRSVGEPTVHTGDTLAAGFGSAWVVNGTGGDVQRVDARTGEAVGRPIEVGSFPVRAAAGEDAVWVVNSDSGTLSRIDPRTNRVTGRPIPVGRGATDVAVGAGAVWVANPASGQLVRIDPSTPEAEPLEVDVPDARWVAVGDDAVWVRRQGQVVRVDPRSGRVVGEPESVAGGGPVAIADGVAWVARPDEGDLVRLAY